MITNLQKKHGRVGHVFTTSCTLRLPDGSHLPAGVNQDLEELEHYHEGSTQPESLFDDSEFPSDLVAGGEELELKAMKQFDVFEEV